MKSFLVKNPIKAPFLFLAFFVLVFAIDFSSPAAAVTQPPATTPSSSISFEKQEELKQLFFETEGTLKPVDTTLHQKGDGFIMDQARYRLQASTQLSNQNPININYQDLNISLIPNNINPQTKEGRLIQNGSEIEAPTTQNSKTKASSTTTPTATAPRSVSSPTPWNFKKSSNSPRKQLNKTPTLPLPSRFQKTPPSPSATRIGTKPSHWKSKVKPSTFATKTPMPTSNRPRSGIKPETKPKQPHPKTKPPPAHN